MCIYYVCASSGQNIGRQNHFLNFVTIFHRIYCIICASIPFLPRGNENFGDTIAGSCDRAISCTLLKSFSFSVDARQLWSLFKTICKRGRKGGHKRAPASIANRESRIADRRPETGEWQGGRIADTPNVTSRYSYLFAIISARLVSIGLLRSRYPSKPIQKYYAILEGIWLAIDTKRPGERRPRP